MTVDNVLPDPVTMAAIRADVEAYEAQRKSAAANTGWRLLLFLALLGAVVYVGARLFNTIADPYEQWVSAPHLSLYVAGIILAAVIWFLVTAPVRRARADPRGRLFPSIFRFIDDFTYGEGKPPSSFDRLPREMVGAFNRETFDDVITGKYRGFPFEMFEARLSQAGDSDAFKGIGLVFEAAKPFPGIVIAGRAAPVAKGFFGTLFGKELEAIHSGVADLDKVYAFRTDNLAAAQPLIVGRLASALKWLGETWPAGQPLVALKGGDAFVLLPTDRDYFALPDAGAPLDFDADVKPLIAELVAMLETAALLRRVGGDEAA